MTAVKGTRVSSEGGDITSDDNTSASEGEYEGSGEDESGSEIELNENGIESYDEVESDDNEDDSGKDVSQNSTFFTEETSIKKSQSALASVLGSLLSKNKTDKEILSKAKKDRDIPPGRKKKPQKPLEIVLSDGTISKLEDEESVPITIKKEHDQLRPLSKKRKADTLYRTAQEDVNVVKEKKLRSLATKGVVQLFNTLEQYRQEKKGAFTQEKKRTTQVSEMSAITSGNSGLIDFLSKKTMGGERKLFGEVKDEDDDQM
ncbi:RRP15-like protein [Hyalella azteca]|uniref:RRP15-like protein n=1 Tax=Hyalella azteca TaxID=294128 RepID=A0A8B7N696_HYAAZ|nr:RRP15-like protein [Hyalella azteca]